MKIQVYLNEGKDNYFGFHNKFANAPALRLAVTFELDNAEATIHAMGGDLMPTLEYVYHQLNVGDDPDFGTPTPWTVEYRRNRNRSLSVGDVVVIGETAYAVDSIGFRRITTDDLLDAINRFRAVMDETLVI